MLTTSLYACDSVSLVLFEDNVDVENAPIYL